ncbi:MAG: NADPH-dependent FMN reductase [Sporichthyaceae bacterium]
MTRIGIVVGSTRAGRRSDLVANWVWQWASKRDDAQFEVLDLKDVDLPFFDDASPPAMGQRPSDPRAQRWSDLVDGFDGFVFVTPEYNHGPPGVLKNAIDHLFTPWHNKAAGFVSYGSTGGVRAVEQLRLILAEVRVATVRSQVALSLFTDFEIEDFAEPGRFTPAERQETALSAMLDEVVDWSLALSSLRRAG